VSRKHLSWRRYSSSFTTDRKLRPEQRLDMPVGGFFALEMRGVEKGRGHVAS
jgi:hypothetical protein